jgi:RNA polymerase sigma factor (sigma-70 family)
VPPRTSAPPMSRVSNERAAWLARAVLPHEPALRTWLKRKRKRVVGLEVDDIVQETYAKLVALKSVDGIRDARSYTFQIAYSIVVSQIRRARIVSILASADVGQIPSPDASIEHVLEVRDELSELARALAELPEKCRTVFALRRVEGLSQREAAARLGISEKTVEKHMARGIRLLMDRFGRGGKPSVYASRDIRDTDDRNDERKAEQSGD